jgi:signal transduction histidine kinase
VSEAGTPEDWEAHRREMWRRRRGWGYGPPWRRRRPGPFARGFGCLAGLVFLIVVASLLAAATSFIEQFGPLPAVVAIAAVVGLLAVVARRLRRAALSLDRIVDAAARVEEGDYSARVGELESTVRPIRSLAGAFDTMVDRLERDEDQRRTLLNDVSHELRTPLSVIAGNLEAMIDGVHPADEAHLTAILEQAVVMERLIDDLRTMALSEAGTLPLHREPTDPDVLIDEVVRSFAGAGGTADVTVTADVPSDLPIIDVDPVRLREVLANLVGNAVRHAPSRGTVVVRARVAGGVDGPGDRLEIRVIDSGRGIDPDVLPHVFDRFVKGAGSTGSGLGLSIARYLVAAHGGTLEVEATGSAGTTFLATLPIAGS